MCGSVGSDAINSTLFCIPNSDDFIVGRAENKHIENVCVVFKQPMKSQLFVVVVVVVFCG